MDVCGWKDEEVRLVRLRLGWRTLTEASVPAQPCQIRVALGGDGSSITHSRINARGAERFGW